MIKKIMDFKVLSEDKLLTVTSDDGAGDLHCDTDSNTVLCYTHVSIEMTGGGGGGGGVRNRNT